MDNNHRLTKRFFPIILKYTLIAIFAIMIVACSKSNDNPIVAEITKTQPTNSLNDDALPSKTPVATQKPVQIEPTAESAETPLKYTPQLPRAYDPVPPEEPVKLVFIHHSVGEAWLWDNHGRLAPELANNNYFVSDIGIGWGPDRIGDRTDYGWWWEWFGGPNHTQIMAALFSENGQTIPYGRLSDPGGENEIVMIKPCFTNHPVCGNADDPPTAGDNPPRNFYACPGNCITGCQHTVGNIKRVLLDILETFRQYPDKLFVIVTAPPPMEEHSPNNENSRALTNWMYYDWLDGYDGNNVVVYDLFNVWTTNGGDYDTNDLGLATGNHHRLTSSPPYVIEHITDGDDDSNPNVMEYPECCYNAHPNKAGARKATGEFVPLLNAYYNSWKTD